MMCRRKVFPSSSLILILSSYLVKIEAATLRDDIPGRTALDNFPLIDGHNDLPHNLNIKLRNQFSDVPFETNLKDHPIFGLEHCKTCHTDFVRLRQGKVGGQFWAAFVECTLPEKEIVPATLAQIDVIKRFVKIHSKYLEFVTTADGIVDAFKRKKIASLIGLEGGHTINNRLAILRQYYDLGVRYMTLTHFCHLSWADASPIDDADNTDQEKKDLTDFGKKVVLEMNRLGMLVDLSHVSYGVMGKALEISKAPVIFSHSSAFSVWNHTRNVRDDILEKVKTNGGIVMVNFYSSFIGDGNVTIRNVIDHINHIVDKTGVDHVGLGSDFGGINSVPVGLEDVSKYPDLFDLLKELDPDRWTIENLEKLAGRNFVRVFKQAEKVRDELADQQPDDSLIPDSDIKIKSNNDCIE